MSQWQLIRGKVGVLKNKPKNSYLQIKLINSTMDSGKPEDVCGIVQGK